MAAVSQPPVRNSGGIRQSRDGGSPAAPSPRGPASYRLSGREPPLVAAPLELDFDAAADAAVVRLHGPLALEQGAGSLAPPGRGKGIKTRALRWKAGRAGRRTGGRLPAGGGLAGGRGRLEHESDSCGGRFPPGARRSWDRGWLSLLPPGEAPGGDDTKAQAFLSHIQLSEFRRVGVVV